MDSILLKITALAYLAAAASFFLYLLRGETASRLPTALLLFGFTVHSSALVGRFFQEGFSGIAVMGHAMLFYGWLMIGI